MKKRIVKKTGDEIYPLGFGAMRLPLKNTKIDYQKAKELLYYAIDNGVNYIDTAAMYRNGENEKLLGDILTGKYRDVLISTKLPVYSIKTEEDLYKELNKQLKRLKRDTIDYYYLHNIDLKTLRRIEKLNIYSFLDNAKKEGKIRNVGFSYHGVKNEFNDMIDSYNWDVVMVQYNYIDEKVQAGIDGIKYAASKDIAVVIMEPLKGGILAGKMPEEVEKIFKNKNPLKSNVEWSMSWILNNPEITCVLSGMRTLEEIKENLAIANKVKPNSLTKDDINTVKKAKEIMNQKIKINCTTCGYCLPCPNGVNIPESLKLYNEKYLFDEKGFINQSRINYFTVTGGIMNAPSYAGLCNKCGKCIKKCPQRLNIPRELDKVKKELEVPGMKIVTKLFKHIGIKIAQLFEF